MLREMTALAVLGACTALGGCASIVHSGPRTVTVASTPPGANVSIYDRDNKLVMTNTTPFVAKLPVKYAYFKSQTYRLEFDLQGYAHAVLDIDSSVSGWYWGNFAIGGLLGMVVIDPLTGAMFNLSPDKINQTLRPAEASAPR